MHLKEIFEQLWNDYSTRNQSTQAIYDLFSGQGEVVINDHIAFRTFDDPRVNIDFLAKPFISRGYVGSGSYIFEKKHLLARHYELPGDDQAPRVFISELKCADFSPRLQEVVKNSIDQIPKELLNDEKLIFSGNAFGKPDYETYEFLREESEYAAWMYVFGFRANHFTVSVNHLRKYNTLEKVNDFIKSKGFKLNTSGGEIKGTPEQLLRQSSTLADFIEIDFTSGIREIPSCYYEFAQRYTTTDGKLYSGFIAASADKIFESTDFRKQG